MVVRFCYTQSKPGRKEVTLRIFDLLSFFLRLPITHGNRAALEEHTLSLWEKVCCGLRHQNQPSDHGALLNSVVGSLHYHCNATKYLAVNAEGI